MHLSAASLEQDLTSTGFNKFQLRISFEHRLSYQDMSLAYSTIYKSLEREFMDSYFSYTTDISLHIRK